MTRVTQIVSLRPDGANLAFYDVATGKLHTSPSLSPESLTPLVPAEHSERLSQERGEPCIVLVATLFTLYSKLSGITQSPSKKGTINCILSLK